MKIRKGNNLNFPSKYSIALYLPCSSVVPGCDGPIVQVETVPFEKSVETS